MRPDRRSADFVRLDAGVVLIALLASTCLLVPATAAAQGAGSAASTVLRIPPAPRPLALGNALVAVDDAWAFEYNPAAVAVDGLTLAAGYQTLPVGAAAGAAVIMSPVRHGFTLGASTRFVDYGHIDVIEPDPTLPIGHPTGETATGGELTALVGGLIRRGPVRIGLAARWLRLDVAGLVDDAFAMDGGVALAAAPWLELGASIQNVGEKLEAGRAAPLPRTIRAGAALRRPHGPVDGLLALEARRREGRTGVGAGLEVASGGDAIQAMARLGYESRAAAGDAYSRFVFGGGVRVERLTVDVAYRALGPLGATRQVGVSYRF